MQHTLESKSQLAKLMASENIKVEHRKVATASFNLHDRVLTCPIWKDMSGELYDLLLGHEVGHALETPEQGWHNAVMGTGKFNRSFKHFLNVVEDCRIEKKIKRRFPGLRTSFVKGYGELVANDFFGLRGRDINAMPFIDRLNLYTKGGVSLGITFTDEEQKLVDQVEGCETWDDVVRVTEAVYDYSKDEQKQMEEDNLFSSSMSDDYDFDSEESDEYGDFDSSDYDESDSDGDGEEETDNGSRKETTKDLNEDSESDSEEEGKSKNIERFKQSQAVEGLDDFEPICETDINFRENENKLLDEKSKPYVYINVPSPIMSEIVTPYKRVHEQMEEHWFKGNDYLKDRANKLYNEFRKKNERYVSLLAKEFEMRKAATKFAKRKVSETGDIDVSRIYKYQVDDNIFRKITQIPKGKSHGLTLLFDRSGSMDGNMRGTLEQILILAMFCKKVNIPFVVYGFGNEIGGFKLDHGRYPQKSFTENNGEMRLDNVCLREYLNSRMPISEYTRCVKNIIALSASYGYRGASRVFSRPGSECLSNTPMIEAVVAFKTITEQFRKANNLDIVNTVLLHDGDSDSINSYYRDDSISSFHSDRDNVVLRDEKNKIEYRVNNYQYDCGLREAVFNWYQKTTGAKIIGFYITSDSAHSQRNAIKLRYYPKVGKNVYEIAIDELKAKYPERNQRYIAQESFENANTYAKEIAKRLREEKFLDSNNPGYSKFFMIPGGTDLVATDEELTVSGDVTTSKLRNAFIKMNKTRQVNRVLVNKFIGEIAV